MHQSAHTGFSCQCSVSQTFSVRIQLKVLSVFVLFVVGFSLCPSIVHDHVHVFLHVLCMAVQCV